MRLPKIEATIQAELAAQQPPEPASAEFAERFTTLTDRFFAVCDQLADHPMVEIHSGKDVTVATGFTFVDDLEAVRRIINIYPTAFDDISNCTYGKPALHTVITARAEPRNAIEAETELVRAGHFKDGFGVADSSFERLGRFWELIRLPGAAVLNYTADFDEYVRKETAMRRGGPYQSSELQDHDLIPKFTTHEERFDSFHGAIDVIEQTPRG